MPTRRRPGPDGAPRTVPGAMSGAPTPSWSPTSTPCTASDVAVATTGLRRLELNHYVDCDRSQRGPGGYETPGTWRITVWPFGTRSIRAAATGKLPRKLLK